MPKMLLWLKLVCFLAIQCHPTVGEKGGGHCVCKFSYYMVCSSHVVWNCIYVYYIFCRIYKKKTPFVLVSTGTYVGLHISPCAPVEFP